ncbi:MAG: hypothetical protein ACOYJV_06875 [Aminivibrio sp.]|jgi:hypothetical protein
MTIFKKFFLLLPLLMLLFSPHATWGAGISVGIDDGWIWQIAVLPPEKGWESDSGRSALGALRYAELQVRDSHEGVAGRDIHFLKEPPLTEENVGSRLEDWRRRGLCAVISLGGEEDVRLLRPLLKEEGPVLVTAFGEEEDIAPEGAPYPMIFALDLYKDFRMAAFTEFAKISLDQGATLAILGDRYDPFLDRFARNLGDMLSAAGFNADHFWIPGAGPDSFRMIEDEAISGGSSVLVSCAGSMVVREIWRAVRQKSSAFEIWYGGGLNRALLSFDGVCVADQNAPLEEDGALVHLGREIWKHTRIPARDRGMAGRTYGVCRWLFEGLKKAGSNAPEKLAETMKEIAGIPLGSLELSINAATHRPGAREVAILKIQGRKLKGAAFFHVAGPEFMP